ncbi:arsenate-mycothiol transferase ArsC [Zunongwangia sp. HRR-M8]|uniref:arsenate-mycothiol transferase ArsC n=1 Tax=Zunongwangia sp. HRR-M8 TaxID=3015170 RepID=UPI0022DD3AAC|nr:protein-tyrosine-phosphatase [Zunongwangia sp. HRR-M8]WBL22905.1 protein-tyrosine-phosphatase [Zunongwangia sp. HRR-M8]
MYNSVQQFITSLDITTISEERKKALEVFIRFIAEKIKNKETVNLNFICTHNSRRSHFSQIWAQTIADYLSLKNVNSYSGGTEATAVYSSVLKTFEHVGFSVGHLSEEKNPFYFLKFSEDALPILSFSKVYNHAFNPKKNFVSVMTCSQANEACPFVPGAEVRIPFTFEDPKISDGKKEEFEKYLEKSREIANDLLYVFTKAKELSE